MDTAQLRRPTDWFRVAAYKKVDDPTQRVGRREILVSLAEYPQGFSLGPNPREPKLDSPVAKKIARTLEEDGENLHLLNRGVTLVAKGLEYDPKGQRVRLKLADGEDEERWFGILDGGNTDAQVKAWRAELADEQISELAKRFINVQVLLPNLKGAPPTSEMESLLNDIKEARNTSVQVKSKSLADARHQFDALKAILEPQPYFQRISWHEGQPGTIDVLTFVTYLMMFYPGYSAAADGGEPNSAYGHKERCLDAFLEFSEKEPDNVNRWIKILPDIVRLYDHLLVTFPDAYEGRFGRITEVRIYDERVRKDRPERKYVRTPMKSPYFGEEMKYGFPQGWIYPLFASFRALAAVNRRGEVAWKRDPIAFWTTYGKKLALRYEPHMREAGYEVRKIASNVICYQAMRAAVNEMYKDELLKEKGVEP